MGWLPWKTVGVYLNTKYWKVKFYSRLICPVFSNKDTKWIYLKQCYLGKNIYLTGSLRVHWYNTGTAQYCLKRRWRETPAQFKALGTLPQMRAWRWQRAVLHTCGACSIQGGFLCRDSFSSCVLHWCFRNLSAFLFCK